MATRTMDSLLPSLLGALLPGNSEWPSAGDTHVPTFIANRASELPELARALASVRDVLPSDFTSRDFEARMTALREAESRLPDAFALIVTEAYRGYYTDPRVLALIERKTRYPARSPQPLGRAVRAGDWSDLGARAIAAAPLPALLDSLGDPHDS
ncbi:MAG TPA: hypothetical protein VFO35_09825 [Steroidobacteraceae bacterium]|nr:hypothetical protein [Steroidobacteraceae bacterium]